MKNLKQLAVNVGAILFAIFIVIGWFQPEGYWWFVGLNPFDLADHIFHFIMGLFN